MPYLPRSPLPSTRPRATWAAPRSAARGSSTSDIGIDAMSSANRPLSQNAVTNVPSARLRRPRARRDQDHVPPARGAALEGLEGRRREREHAVARRLEVVEQPDPPRGKARRERRLVELPGEIGRDTPSVHDGPGDAEARSLDRRPRPAVEEARHGVLEGRELAAWQRRLALEHERAVAKLEQGERRLGPADVAGQDHYFLAPE